MYTEPNQLHSVAETIINCGVVTFVCWHNTQYMLYDVDQWSCMKYVYNFHMRKCVCVCYCSGVWVLVCVYAVTGRVFYFTDSTSLSEHKSLPHRPCAYCTCECGLMRAYTKHLSILHKHNDDVECECVRAESNQSNGSRRCDSVIVRRREAIECLTSTNRGCAFYVV